MNVSVKKGGVCYFLFRNSISASGVVVTYWKPFSIRFSASVSLVAILPVYSSSSCRFCSWTYFSVVSIFLCPICCLTYSMSFVFAYSFVA